MPPKAFSGVGEFADHYTSMSGYAWTLVSRVEALYLLLPKIEDEIKEALKEVIDTLIVNDEGAYRLITRRRNFFHKIFHSNSHDQADMIEYQATVRGLTDALVNLTISGFRVGSGTILKPSDATIRFGIGPSEVRNVEVGLPHQWITHTNDAQISGSNWCTLLKGQLVLLDSSSLQDVMIKKIIYTGHDKDTRIRRTRRERDIWKTLDSYNHPNILPYYGTYYHEGEGNRPEEERVMYLVAPLAEGGDLDQYIEMQAGKPKDYRFKLLGDIIMGLELLHEGRPPFRIVRGPTGENVVVEEEFGEARTQIYHGDLHIKNILVYLPKSTPNRPIAWLADFGISVQGNRASTNLTQVDFRAPEIRQFTPVPKNMTAEERNAQVLPLLEKADVFSFGCTAFCLLTERIYERFNFNVVPRWTRPEDISEGLYKLIRECCDEDPGVRPTVAEIRKRCNELEVRFEDAENRAALGLPKREG